ncbi:4-(cytidine 5'-diphospho)-2-C-methyl-D-erythritol kinase [Lampropedia aestuarii]|uniref:4-diphosphocytidyl-2-C-methyl-D-erythritol kinase n=1 Tax=Lampropedia aestuarii TaxID=2562762 RepID=A0A4S5BU85_9BURK|nr:4-(cytidine 5'-diphospho)-2-C-methyl-D-erythritol kinase [Lampropedia aestuarii]THJ34661.1 4-(cytidine 5'-diphospho)-2-C-methyl-D-erythritol kinase [Lampropedia aestuarii]
MVRLENVLAPAKLNLFLHITGVRSDGYHLLQSAFVLIDWYDVLHFELRPNSNQISREDLTQVLPERDLIVRAAQALQQAAGVQQGVHIQVEKNIPAEAGMGGGSSDAASTLMALNRLWQLNWSSARLQQLGLTLGADVPFFIGGTNAWVEGIGEQLTPLTGALALPEARMLVVKPQAGLSTSAIFSDPNLKRSKSCATISSFTDSPYDFGCNVLQEVAERKCSEIKKLIFFLKQRKFQVTMTGSGSAVFAKIDDTISDVKLNEVLMQINTEFIGSKAKICKVLSVHPFLDVR